jgi:hypothetical protein
VSDFIRATLNFEANIDGVNTSVAALEAELKQARYYLDNTTMVAPEDGHVVNLQVRPAWFRGFISLAGSRHSLSIATVTCWRRITRRT